MPCNFPLNYFELPADKQGNARYKICPTGQEEYFDYSTGILYKHPKKIPCGKCIGCRLDYARQWSIRIQMELQEYEHSSFVTLTYDNEHIPHSDTHFENATLRKRDVQLFIKRLRKAYPDNDIRYYAAGEYGPHTMRPHYHLIIFGWFPDDAEFWKTTQQGFSLFVSEELSTLWQHKGFVSLSAANMTTGAYCARYVTSKLSGSMAKTAYDDLGIEPPFALMSRRPSLGLRWFEKHYNDILKYTKLSIKTDYGAVSFNIPKYFLYKLKLTNEDDYAKVKSKLDDLCDCVSNNERNSRYTDYAEMMLASERIQKAKIKSLIRSDTE